MKKKELEQQSIKLKTRNQQRKSMKTKPGCLKILIKSICLQPGELKEKIEDTSH